MIVFTPISSVYSNFVGFAISLKSHYVKSDYGNFVSRSEMKLCIGRDMDTMWMIWMQENLMNCIQN